jgi:mRNA interferase HigB
MRVIKRSALLQFGQDQPGALEPLRNWYRAVRAASWRSFADVRRMFTTADLVHTKRGVSVVVFDIGGNRFRLIVHVSYPKKKVYVLRVMTHKEYDRGRWKDEL